MAADHPRAAVAFLAAVERDLEIVRTYRLVGKRLRRSRLRQFVVDGWRHSIIYAVEDAVIVVAPRLIAALITDERAAPLGGECWKTSRILLPEALRGRTFRNVFTGEELKPTASAGQSWLFVGEVLHRLPVALLRTV